jgi:hypothetical protein
VGDRAVVGHDVDEHPQAEHVRPLRHPVERRQVADPVAVGVGERAVDLVHDGVPPPVRPLRHKGR